MRIRVLIILLTIFLLRSGILFADTVVLKDGTRVKGLILDEFKDRIVMSTAEGEKVYMKSSIRAAVYDDEVKALMQKARNQTKRGQYVKAYYTYEKAAKIDPDLEEAQERVRYMRNYLEGKTRDDIINSLDRKNQMEGKSAPGETPNTRLLKELGLELSPGDKYVVVEKAKDTGGYVGDIMPKPGDRIVSVWGEMTAYMDDDEVASELLSAGEVRFEIERTVFPELKKYKPFQDGFRFPRYKGVIGGAIALVRSGVMVTRVFRGGSFQKAGIRKGDLIWRLNGRNLRYMPVKEVVDTFTSAQGEKVEVVFRRDIVLWRKDQRS